MNNSEWGNPNDFFHDFSLHEKKVRPVHSLKMDESSSAHLLHGLNMRANMVLDEGIILKVRLPPSTPWIWIPLYRYLKSTVGSTQTLSP